MEILCTRCNKDKIITGAYCESCKIDIADQQYLDDGSVCQMREEVDRRNSGEYADLHEGDDCDEQQTEL